MVNNNVRFLCSRLFVIVVLMSIMLSCSDRKEEGDDYKPDIESLKKHECPEWFRDAKFGIFMHWGIMSVVEGNSGWYGRHMYMQNNYEWGQDYDRHTERYGHPSKFGYKDLIPLWKAENWDPDNLVKFYKQIGAKYIVPVAVHHDNFDLYDSSYQPWNSVNMGPKKDVIGEWKKAADKYGMRFGVSSHNDRSWTWLQPVHRSDVSGPLQGVPYDGNLTKEDGEGQWWKGYNPTDLYTEPHDSTEAFSRSYCNTWYNRMIELIDNYQPDLIYFDGPLPIIGSSPACNKAYKWSVEYGVRMAAHYFNKNKTWHEGNNEAVITLKEWKGFPLPDKNAFTEDVEKGGLNEIQDEPWQTCTSLSGTWFWNGNPHNEISDTVVIHNLCDVVSKNGNYLLNVGLTADGQIPEYERSSLENIGAWLEVNGEAIFKTRPWKVFGEGPTTIAEGEFKQNKHPFTEEDIRFTQKEEALYAIFMGWPSNGIINVKSLGQDNDLWSKTIKEVSLLGSREELSWEQKSENLEIKLPENKPCNYAYTLKIQ